MTRDEAATVILGKVLVREGGVRDVGDGKGVTRFGQTPSWLETFGFSPPQTAEDALANYRTWLVRTQLIGICDYPDALADVVVDWAVHSGHRVAIRAVQRAVGAPPDGIWGPETQQAVDRANRGEIAKKVLAGKARLLGRLVTDDPEKNAEYAAGWMNRLAEQIETL